jgi:hypothetical protein
MLIGVWFLGDFGIRAGSVEATSQEEFLGTFAKNGWIHISLSNDRIQCAWLEAQ